MRVSGHRSVQPPDYRQQTEPLTQTYARRSLLIEIDAAGAVDDVFARTSHRPIGATTQRRRRWRGTDDRLLFHWD